MEGGPIDLTSRPRKNPSATSRMAGDGGVILHLETGQYHGVNRLGWELWELVDGTRTVAEVAEVAREGMDDAPPHFVEDVVSLLEGMRERDLIVT